jgi:hypothetical protein
MPKTCLNCKAVALKDVPTLSCGACRSAVYCCKACQKKDWKEHKKICKSLNIGEGAMQVQYPAHVKYSAKLIDKYTTKQNSIVTRTGSDSSNSLLNLRSKEVRLRRER